MNRSKSTTLKHRKLSLISHKINPCLSRNESTLQKYSSFSILYSNKQDFFYPYCNKRLKLFGTSKVPPLTNNSIPYIPKLDLNFKSFSVQNPSTNTNRIYERLTHRCIKDVLNESNFYRMVLTPR